MLPNCNSFLNSTNHLINTINQQPNQQETNVDNTHLPETIDLIAGILDIDESKVFLTFSKVK
jgi:hypothetical protein